MRWRQLVALCGIAFLLATGPSRARPAHAHAPARRIPPRLLAYDPGGTFLVRPTFMSFDETWHGHLFNYLFGAGLTMRGFTHGKTGRIRWTRWGPVAVGEATYWWGPTDSCGSVCRYLRFVVTVHASLVRHGHYTRLRFFYRGSRFTLLYVLKTITIRVKGVQHGFRAFTWCDSAHRARCLTP